MKKIIIIIFLFSISKFSIAQDEFVQHGTYIPQFFSELLDAEIYSQNELYIVGVGGVHFY